MFPKQAFSTFYHKLYRNPPSPPAHCWGALTPPQTCHHSTGGFSGATASASAGRPVLSETTSLLRCKFNMVTLTSFSVMMFGCCPYRRRISISSEGSRLLLSMICRRTQVSVSQDWGPSARQVGQSCVHGEITGGALQNLARFEVLKLFPLPTSCCLGFPEQLILLSVIHPHDHMGHHISLCSG